MAMIRLRSDELVLSDGVVVYYAGGKPGAPRVAQFQSLRAMNCAIVKAVFAEFLRRGRSVSSSHYDTARECGYESASAIQKIISSN
jgi:hypothetical protein